MNNFSQLLIANSFGEEHKASSNENKLNLLGTVPFLELG
jgi:hypothetical protein